MECRGTRNFHIPKKKVKTHTFVQLNVNRTPPDVVLGGLFVYDTLVLWAATGLLARKVDQRTIGRDDSPLIANGILVQLCDRGVALDLNAIHVEAGLGEVFEVTTDDYWCSQ